MNSRDTIFLHIGFPKCISTTLQRSFFEKHNDIHYGGVGIKDNISYQTEEIEFIFECLLKYANDRYWNLHKEKARNELKDFIQKAENRKIVFSSEHLSMNFTTQGIDNEEKYRRVNFLFEGFAIKLLMVVREPISLIRSLYREFVKMGYYDTYEEFLKWIIVYQDRNFLFDLDYSQKIKELESHFGENCVKQIEFNKDYKIDINRKINADLSAWLDIRNLGLQIRNDNPSMTHTEIASLLNVNKKVKRGLGYSQLEPFERHRNRLLYQKAGVSFEESEIFENVILKREALKNIESEALILSQENDISHLESLIIKQIIE